MMNNKNNSLLVLLGPTGVGKTEISIKLAQKIPDVEIISADSMQIYKYMDIGTAKPGKNILKIIKHHMIDIVNPPDNFDVVKYSKLATNIILDVFNLRISLKNCPNCIIIYYYQNCKIKIVFNFVIFNL